MISAIEDLLEELVGEILSENDRPDSAMSQEADGSWLVGGHVPIHEFSRAVGQDLPGGDFSTVAGLVLHVAGIIPAAGWSREIERLKLEVVEATQRRVNRVRVRIS